MPPAKKQEDFGNYGFLAMYQKNHKSSILFIAPYRHMALVAKQVIQTLKMDIPVVVAFDSGAVNALRKFPEAKIVISRGGTSKWLKGIAGLTVVELTASFYDVFLAVKTLSDRGCRNISVVSQENIIGLGRGDLKVFDRKINLYPCLTAEDTAEKTQECIKNGSDGIAGCVIAVDTAKKLGVQHAFVDADFSTVKKALLEAASIEKTLKLHELTASRMSSVLNNIEEGVVIFNDLNEPMFYNEFSRTILYPRLQQDWYELLSPFLQETSRVPKTVSIEGHNVFLRTIFLKDDTSSTNTVVIINEVSSEKVQNAALVAQEKGLVARFSFKDILFTSTLMQDTVDLAERFAHSDSTVMIFGETGVGKEGFAQSIHNASARRNRPFVSVNCASLPQGLVASELFGYVEGAFTGARHSGKKGLFEMAQGGTIFLDEVTELPPEVQSLLLRVIQERELMRIGDDRMIPLDIRIICASNKRIRSLCDEGRFRYDLYYRLSVLRLEIPPLRERGVDILFIFRHFFSEFIGRAVSATELGSEVENLLLSYDWPGNVRELKNIAEALSFYGECIHPDDLEKLLKRDQPESSRVGLTVPLDISLKELESRYLKELLKTHSDTETARISGLSRTTLWRRIQEMNLKT